MLGGGCPRCCTPLVETAFRLETDDEKFSCEEQVFVCVKCKKAVLANVRTIVSFLEKTGGSLVLLSNPFEVASSCDNGIYEKIVDFDQIFKYFISSQSLAQVDEKYLEVKAVLHDATKSIKTLFTVVRRLFVTVYLGEFFCQQSIKTAEVNIAKLKQTHTQETMPKFIRIYVELTSSKMKLISMEDDYKKMYGNEYYVSKSVTPLDLQILALESLMDESATEFNTQVESLQNDIVHATSKLQLVQKAATLAHHRIINTWANDVFKSDTIMMKAIDNTEAMIECIKLILQEYIPQSMQEDMSHHEDDLLDMKSLHQELISTSTTCCSCELPVTSYKVGSTKTCHFCDQDQNVQEPYLHVDQSLDTNANSDSEVDSNSIDHGDKCHFCDQDQNLKEPNPHVDQSLDSNANSDSEVDSYSIDHGDKNLASNSIPNRDLSKPGNLGLKITNEVCKRIAQGWILMEKILCSNCGLQKMCDGENQATNLCILCEVVMKETENVVN